MDYSNASIIKNQESDGINIADEQQKYIDDNSIETFQESSDTQSEDASKPSFWSILNKYKFWIISAIILILLIVMAFKTYSSDKSISTSIITGGDILSVESIDFFKLHRKSLSPTSTSSFPNEFVLSS